MTKASLNIPNVSRLIAHLERLPDDRFNMGYVSHETECGTVCCIAGHADILSGREYSAAFFLNLEPQAADQLFMPRGWEFDAERRGGGRQYPLSRAIRTLKHMRSEFLRTGQVVVDWDAPEPEPLSAWTAPKAVELKTDLPTEITRLLGIPSHVEAL